MQLVRKYLCSFRGADSYILSCFACMQLVRRVRAGPRSHLTPAWPQLSVRERGNRRNSTQHERASVLNKSVFEHSGVRVLQLAHWHARSCTQLTQTLARPRAYMRGAYSRFVTRAIEDSHTRAACAPKLRARTCTQPCTLKFSHGCTLLLRNIFLKSLSSLSSCGRVSTMYTMRLIAPLDT